MYNIRNVIGPLDTDCWPYLPYLFRCIPKGSMPTGFFIWGYMYPFTFIFGGTSKFLGVQCTPLTLHLGVQWKLTAFSPRKVVHHAVFCKYYAELAKTFFYCLTLDETWSGVLSDPWPLCLSHHFFNRNSYVYVNVNILLVGTSTCKTWNIKTEIYYWAQK
jgi:hypothetical protein